MKIAVIGAGNGGQAIAGYLASIGHIVSIYDTDSNKISDLKKKGGIQLVGKIEAYGALSIITDSISEAVIGANIIMVTTIANAHPKVAESISPYVEDRQIILLNPGRTCGALVFKQALKASGCIKRYYVGEAQTLVFACRLVENGKVNIIGYKDEVLVAGLPASDTNHILDNITPLFSCFKGTTSVLRTSLENIGAMFHPCVCLFNAATIERQDEFWFYRDMTSQVAKFIEKFDAERLAVGRAYGIELLSVTEWIKYAYNDTAGDTLCERMKNNPAYHDIKAPGSIFTRQLTEDIPTGVLPIMELGKAANISTPLLESMIQIIEGLLDIDLHTNGRSLHNLGLEGKNKEEIIKYITNGE